MVTFTIVPKTSVGILSIKVNENYFGDIAEGHGLSVGAGIQKEFQVSSDDLREIAKKTDEVIDCGVSPPVCPGCKGTPYYPNEVVNPTTGLEVCRNTTHPPHIRMGISKNLIPQTRKRNVEVDGDGFSRTEFSPR